MAASALSLSPSSHDLLCSGCVSFSVFHKDTYYWISVCCRLNVCVSPKSRCRNPTHNGTDGSGRRGLREEIRSCERSPHQECNQCLYKGNLRALPGSSHPVKTLGKGHVKTSQPWEGNRIERTQLSWLCSWHPRVHHTYPSCQFQEVAASVPIYRSGNCGSEKGSAWHRVTICG